MMAGNGEFLINSVLCPEIVHFGKYGSKQCDLWSGCQISEKRHKNDLTNKTQDLDHVSTSDHDNNLVKCERQTTTNHLTKSYPAITISSKVT